VPASKVRQTPTGESCAVALLNQNVEIHAAIAPKIRAEFLIDDLAIFIVFPKKCF
jgi:hypothetical protein